MKSSSYPALLAAAALLCAAASHATVYRHITAEPGSPTDAVINSDGSLTESGVNYAVEFKPVPQGAWVRTPWISPSQAYMGTHSIGMEIDAQTPAGGGTPVDKVNLRLSSGDDSFSLTFGRPRYIGFAMELSSKFQVPLSGSKCLLSQCWQGSPYGPPLRLEITGGTYSGSTLVSVTYEFWVLNDSTTGNPSATPVVIGGGTIPIGSFERFIIYVNPDFNGNGEVTVWQDGTQVLDWAGAVGYDPSTIPYTNPPPGTPNPNPNLDVFFGPYRDEQNTRQQLFYDEVRFADTYADADPSQGGD